VSEFYLILGAGSLCLLAVSLLSWRKASEADASGELIVRTAGLMPELVIRRVDDPKRFAAELMLLRLVPGTAFVASCIGILMMGILK
jgi:hypothetical protein